MSVKTIPYGQNAFSYVSQAKRIEKQMGNDPEPVVKEMLSLSYEELINYFNKRYENLIQIGVEEVEEDEEEEEEDWDEQEYRY